MNRIKLEIAKITTENRQREDYGNLEDLAESMSTLGLIQPIVVNQTGRLIAGGRRLAAAVSLGWTEVDVVYRETLTEDELQELELEENIRRKNLSWQEEVRAVAKIHRLKKRNANLVGTPWGQRETGALLNMALASVNYSLRVAELLEAKDDQINACGNLTEAVRLIVLREETRANAELAGRIYAASPATPTRPGTPSEIEVIEPVASDPEGRESAVIPLSRMCIHGDCLDVMSNMPDYCIDHVVTDPPYGIDMDNLQQENTGMDVSSTAKEHDVKENLKLLLAAVPHMVRVTKPSSFIVMWCDLDHKEFLTGLLRSYDMAVQRWPLIWHKTSPCLNQAAQYNTTKNYESVIIARKPGATLVSPVTSSVFSFSNEKAPGDHPFAKPVHVWDMLLKMVAIRGQTILDPFAGTFSCPRACVGTYFNPIGIEKVEAHYNAGVIKMKAFCDVMYQKPRYE